jgi:predicted acylesterase/phospholipase RssA
MVSPESYGFADGCTIWQAARATSAAPGMFKRIRIGRGAEGEEFLDGGLACNNPIKQVLKEAETVFDSERYISCIVSIGSGQARPGTDLKIPFVFQKFMDLDLNLANAFRTRVADSDSVAEDIEDRFKPVANLYQ